MENKKAVLLLSGGLDSSTTCAIAQSRGFDVYAMSFRYGQKHVHEINCARKLAETFGVKEHIIVDINLGLFGGSALTDPSLELPMQGDGKPVQAIPVSYVPARNTIFLSFALAWAEVLGCTDIFTGVNAVDYSGYPDCRPEYIDAYEAMANLATRAGVEGNKIKIHTPLIEMTKSEIITKGMELLVDYSITNSCYSPNLRGEACGKCDSCTIRLAGFAEAGFVDPALYVNQ